MIERVLNDFDIDQIANSGQCFRFHRVGDKSYDLIAGTHLLNIQQNGRTVRFDCDEDEFNAIWRPYFDLDTDYGRCKAAVAKRDIYLQNAVAYGGGLRILRQDLWETILCFIISQQNNITRINSLSDVKINRSVKCHRNSADKINDLLYITAFSGNISVDRDTEILLNSVNDTLYGNRFRGITH